MLSSLPPLPKTEVDGVDEGVAVDPNALADLDANPPNAEPPEDALASLVPAEEPKALNPEPELGCVVEAGFAPNAEDDDDPKADGAPKAEVVPNAEVDPKPEDEPKAGADVWPNAEDWPKAGLAAD